MRPLLGQSSPAAWGCMGASPQGGTSISSLMDEAIYLVWCGCAKLSFLLQFGAVALGLGISNRLQCGGFFCLNLFAARGEEITALSLGWDVVFGAGCCSHSLFFVCFFLGTTQERPYCKRGDSLMCGTVFWPVCSQTKK